MAFNANEAFSSALSLFASLYQDMNPTDLPEGLSPDNQDIWYLPGSASTRPAMSRLLTNAISGNPRIVSACDLPIDSGDFLTMFMDSNGVLRSNDALNNVTTQIATIYPGVQYKSENAFDKQWYAFFGTSLTSQFSTNPFVGADIPRYYDGKNIWRVTQDAPGAPPVIADSTETATIASISIIKEAVISAATSTAGPGSTFVYVFTTATAHGLSVGQQALVAGVSVAGYNGFYPVLNVASATEFSVQGTVTLASSSGGISCFGTASALITSDQIFNQGDNIIITGNGGNLNNTTATNPQTWKVTETAIVAGRNAVIFSLAGFLFTTTPTGGSDGIISGGQSTAGAHGCVVMFQSFNEAITGTSIPVLFTSVGNTQFACSQIPIGPPGTARRILAFTPANGDNYYYLLPNSIPPSPGVAGITTGGTVINDNVTTSALIDFSDNQLLDGIQIDVQGNDLFSQIVLGPCLSVIEYQSRLFWAGEVNNLKNPLNMGFDGGAVPGLISSWNGLNSITNVQVSSGALIVTAANSLSDGQIVGFSGVATATFLNDLVVEVVSATPTQFAAVISHADYPSTADTGSFGPCTPPGWSLNTLGSGSAVKNIGITQHFNATDGWVFQFLIGSGGATSIFQSVYQDYFGAPIMAPSTQYSLRLKLAGTGAAAGTIQASISSASTGFLASASFLASTLTTTLAWQTQVFNLPTPLSIPSDMILTIAPVGVTGGALISLDDVAIIPTSMPVLGRQLRASYANNPFGYDSETGDLGFDTTASITGMFKQRGYLYSVSTGPLFQTLNNGATEPDEWTVSEYASDVDCAGPCAVTTNEDTAIWAGQSGLRIFSGATPKKISQELQPTWDTINWNATLSIWLTNDPFQRINYIGVPLSGATAVNKILAMSYRAVDSTYNVPDPLHISYSGKLIDSDLSRKWSPWNITADCGAMLTRNLGNGFVKTMCFGGGNGSNTGTAFGEIYSLQFGKYTDDDYGQIFSYYVTYFHWNHDMEQNVPLLGLHRKIYTYLSAFITGVGNVTITPLVDSLTNAWAPVNTVWNEQLGIWQVGTSPNGLPSYQLSQNLTHDLEWGMNVIGDRVAFKVSVSPLEDQTDAYFNLQHIVVSGRMDKVFPVRGAVI